MSGKANKGPEDEHPPMDRQTAEAILEFGDDVRRAGRAAARWAGSERLTRADEQA